MLFIILGEKSFSLEWLLVVLQLTPHDWFIKSYVVLMIIAPILNAYTRNTDEKTQRYVMLAFMLFEAIYGWAAGGRRFFVDGYGPLHFIGLYITAQYIHNFTKDGPIPNWIKKLVQMPKWADMTIYMITVILNTVFVVAGSMYFGSTQGIRGLAFAYSNPLVVVGALFLLLFFTKVKMPYVKLINVMGASSFAVYLFHSQSNIRGQFFNPQIQWMYDNFSGLSCMGLIFLFLCLIYIVSVVIDQARIWSWKIVWNRIEKK